MAIKTFESERHCARIHQCSECDAWSYADRGPKREKIVHQRTCESPEQPGKARAPKTNASAIRRSAKEGTLRAHYSDDEIVDAVCAGQISQSDAMNQDF